MKKVLYLILAALLMNGCSLAELAPPDDYPQKEEGEGTFVPAPLLYAQVDDSDTKTVLDDHTVSFAKGDQISVNGTTYTADETSTRFYAATGSVLDVSSGYLNAYYPMVLWNGGKPALPESYDAEFLTDGTPKFNMPLAAHETYEEGTRTTLHFFHFTAFLGITIKNSGEADSKYSEVSSIAFSTDQQIQGKFTLDYSEKTFSFVDDPEQTISSYVTLNIAEGNRGITADGSKTFYLPLPVGTYGRLLVRVIGKNGETAKTSYMITTEGKPGLVERNTRYILDFTNNFSGYGVPAMGEGEHAVETEETDKDYRY